MANIFTWFWDWLLSIFWSVQADIAILGLQNAGKTTMLRVLAGEGFTDQAMPTVGFNMKSIQKGHVKLQCWDVAGQPRFRDLWFRYARGASVIIFLVDSTDRDAMPVAKEELAALMNDESTAEIPLLVLANKTDIETHMSIEEAIDQLGLRQIAKRELSCYGVSAKTKVNLEAVLEWILEKITKR